MFSKALLKTSSKYNIGLSATPERSDGLMKIVHWFTGNIMYKMDKKYSYKVLIKKILFNSNSVHFKEKSSWLNGTIRPAHTKMINGIALIETRNNLLINIIDHLKSIGRKIIILSSRLDHLKLLKKNVDELIKKADEQHIYNTYLYVGESSKIERKMAEKDGDIIFATQQLAEEGLDIGRLDTIILALPVKKEKSLVQSIGRILRNDKLENLIQVPLVIDLSDMFSIYSKWSEKREEVYNKKKWFIQEYEWTDNKYTFKKNDILTKNPINILLDDTLDELFIENNLVLKAEEIDAEIKPEIKSEKKLDDKFETYCFSKTKINVYKK